MATFVRHALGDSWACSRARHGRDAETVRSVVLGNALVRGLRSLGYPRDHRVAGFSALGVSRRSLSVFRRAVTYDDGEGIDSLGPPLHGVADTLQRFRGIVHGL